MTTDATGKKILNWEGRQSVETEINNPNETYKKTESEKEAHDRQKQKYDAEHTTPAKLRLPQIRKNISTIPIKDDLAVKVEKILEDGLTDAYQHLSPIAKQEFKIKGEKTAAKISELLHSTHVKIKQILRLIVDWLKILPGINRFYLEQEAKIKTDKIMMLKNKPTR